MTNLSNLISNKTEKICLIVKKQEALFPKDQINLEDVKTGTILIYLLALVYVLILSEHVCVSYLMPSLEYFSFEKLGLTPQQAGSTILASASSCSEIMTSLIGVFLARNDLSIHTILGAASYNLLVITSICCFCVYQFETKLSKYQTIRDFLFYAINLLLLLYYLLRNDSRYLNWYNSLTCMVIYLLYIILNIYDSKIQNILFNSNKKQLIETEIIEDNNNKETKMFCILNKNRVIDLNIDYLSTDYNEPYDVFQPYKAFKPLNFSAKFKLSFVFPARLFAFFTIIDFRRFESKKDKFLFVTILTCLIQVGLCSYFLVLIVVRICELFQISETIIGFFFVSLVNSIDETIASISLCKRQLKRIQSKKMSLNHLNMALSNCIGNKIFDITVGIGLPYFLNSLFFTNNFYTYIYNKNVSVLILGLIVSLFLYIFLLILSNFRFTKYFGCSTLFIWSAYSIFVVMVQLDLFKFELLNYFIRKC